MRAIEQLELPLWTVLKEAAIAPDTADVGQLLDVLDGSLTSLETRGQLQVAAEAIAQIVQVFQVRSTVAFEELEATASDEGPVMPADAFDRYVRQSMEVDFEQFIEPIESLPRKAPELRVLEDGKSIVGELDQAALLQALDEQMAQEPGLTEVEAFNRAINVAHDEDVSAWTAAIAGQFAQQEQAIELLDLQQSVGMPLIQIWLAVLLGNFRLESRGAFYEAEAIWVSPR